MNKTNYDRADVPVDVNELVSLITAEAAKGEEAKSERLAEAKRKEEGAQRHERDAIAQEGKGLRRIRTMTLVVKAATIAAVVLVLCGVVFAIIKAQASVSAAAKAEVWAITMPVSRIRRRLLRWAEGAHHLERERKRHCKKP
jgi:hypothetical protein